MPTFYEEYFGPGYQGAIPIPEDWRTDASESWGVLCYRVLGVMTTEDIGFIEE